MSPADPLGGLGSQGGPAASGDHPPVESASPSSPSDPSSPDEPATSSQRAQPHPARVGVTFQAHGTPTAFALLFVLGAFFIAQCALGNWDTQDPLAIFRMGALHWVAVLDGDIFRLGSYSFLHVGVAHFLLNAWALWILMRPIEAAFGSVGALGIYAAAVLMGGGASMAWAIHEKNPFMLAAGASGGIFGLFGAQISLWLRLRTRLPPEASKAAIRGLLLNLGLNVVISWQAAANGISLDNSAHIGGICAGVLFGLLAPIGVLPRRFWSRPAQILLVLSTFTLASMEGAALARAVHPRPRFLQGDGVVAEAPWMLVPAVGGVAVSPGGIAMEARIKRLSEPLALDAGSEALRIGDRTWVRATSETEQGETILTLTAQEGQGTLRIEVLCASEVCRGGLAADASMQLARTIRLE